MKKADVDKLVRIYNALSGIASEYGEEHFSRFYSGRKSIFEDFASVLESAGVEVRRSCEYTVESYFSGLRKGAKLWSISCDGVCVLSGFETADDAVATVKNPEIITDWDGSEIRVRDLAERNLRKKAV